jgi:hypothetical protein
MQIPDIINGAFEALGAVTTLINIMRLHRDREIKGIFWPVWLVYTAWGTWNLFYYTHLGQWASFIAGIAVVAGNLVWTTQAILIALKTSYAKDYQPMFVDCADTCSGDAGCRHPAFDTQTCDPRIVGSADIARLKAGGY